MHIPIHPADKGFTEPRFRIRPFTLEELSAQSSNQIGFFYYLHILPVLNNPIRKEQARIRRHFNFPIPAAPHRTQGRMLLPMCSC